MSIKKIKVDDDQVEVLNTSENPNPKITRIKADEEYSSSNSSGSSNNPFEQAFGNMSDDMKQNPMVKMMGNMGEIKKIKPYFFFSLLFGFISLFGFREILAPLAIILGILDIWLGSKLTQTASYLGITFGMIGLVLYFA